MKKIIYILLFLGFNQAIFAADMEIYGKVVDKTTRRGIKGAKIVVFPSGKSTKTRANGNFYLKVKKVPGMFLQILKSGYRSVKVIRNLNEVFVQMLLNTRIQGRRVIVTARRDKKKVVVSRQRLSRKQLKQTTSSIFEDTVRVVQTLPGVVTRGFSTRMYIRGGDFYEFSAFYDRVYLTNPYILGGALTVFNPEVVKNVDFYSGAFPAAYNNGMSGILDVQLRDGSRKKWQGFAELSLTSITFLIEGPLTGDKNNNNSFLMAFRRTHYDLVAKLFLDRSGVQLPFFYDTHIRWKIQLDKQNIFRIFTLGVYEGVDIEFDDLDSDESARFKKGSYASYKNVRILQGFSLTTAFSDKLVMANTLSYLFRWGDLNFFTDANQYLQIKPQENYIQYRTDLTYKPNTSHIIKTGISGYTVFTSLNYDILQRGFTSGYPEGTYQDTQVPYNKYEEKFKGRLGLIATYYLQDDIQLVKNRFFLNLGVNIQWLNLTKKWIIDPRAGIKWSIPRVMDIKLAGGIYSQFPVTKEFGRVVDKKYGNTDIKPETSYHGVLSFEKHWKEYFARIDFFGKYYDNLVTEDYEKNYVNGEIGYSYGFDVFFQKKLGGKLDGWISYTFVITRRKVVRRITEAEYLAKYGVQKGNYRLPYDEWYAPDYDRRHTLNIVLNYSFTKKWKLSFTFKFGSGLPYTDVIGRYVYGIDNAPYSGTADEYDYAPKYGPFNKERTPLYMNLDIKLSTPFFWDNWSFFIQVINAFSRTNIEGYRYEETYTKRTPITSLPLIPIFGIRANF